MANAAWSGAILEAALSENNIHKHPASRYIPAIPMGPQFWEEDEEEDEGFFIRYSSCRNPISNFKLHVSNY